ncbi:MAG: cytochrome C, partial [Leptothrix sp. (in: b-proteobacteria)]
MYAADATKLDNATCQTCHDGKKGKLAVAGKDGAHELAAVDAVKYGKSIHGDMQCVECHKEITDAKANHAKAAGVSAPDCISCHESLWAQAQKDKLTDEKPRLGLVVENIAAYKQSFHAKPDDDNPDKAKASCEQCHSTHTFNVPPKGSERRTAWHREIPKTCGEQCHEDQYEEYQASIHGEEVLEKGNAKAAVCTDCHSAHSVTNTSSDKFKLANVNACGSCHKEEFKSYTDTYHGQVNRLGFTYT